MKKTILFAALFCFCLVKGQTVITQYGPIVGHSNGNVFEFLGIPYAAPPIGNLRWRPTQAPSNWTQPLLANSFPPACPQKQFLQGQPDTIGTVIGDEDCLYLNVWSPDLQGNYPVMVFIHGGGNQQGATGQVSANTHIYSGKNLSNRGDVVVVTIQYRLGALGYLVHPALDAESATNASGNYGVMDHIFALQWVQQNIAAFGGNPNNVTIFGESAGAVNVSNLLTTNHASGLFHKAIIQSGSPVLSSYNAALNAGIDYVNSFIPTGSNAAKLAYMRQLPADSFSARNTNSLLGGVVQMGWGPVRDNVLFTNFPQFIIQSSNYNKVPVMVGSNADEMSLSAPQNITPNMVTALINARMPANLRTTALNLYPPGSTNAQARQSYIGILTDAQFTTNARKVANCLALNQLESVYRYAFNHRHTSALPTLYDLGAYHGMELFYVFNTWEETNAAVGMFFTPQDDSVQNIMRSYWTNFAHNGNPNGIGLPVWSAYNAATDSYIELKATPTTNLTGYRTAACNLWDSTANYVGCTSSIGFSEDRIEDVLIFPNPSAGIFYIKSGRDTVQEIRVYNTLGQEVYGAKNQSIINLGSQPNGMYVAHIATKSVFLVEKLMLVK